MRPVQLDQWPLRAQYESKCGVEDDVTAALERAYASDLPVTVTYSEKTNYLKMTPEKYFPVYAVSVPGVIDRTYADCAAQVKWNSKILAWIFASITLVVLLQLAWRYLRREPA